MKTLNLITFSLILCFTGYGQKMKRAKDDGFVNAFHQDHSGQMVFSKTLLNENSPESDYLKEIDINQDFYVGLYLKESIYNSLLESYNNHKVRDETSNLVYVIELNVKMYLDGQFISEISFIENSIDFIKYNTFLSFKALDNKQFGPFGAAYKEVVDYIGLNNIEGNHKLTFEVYPSHKNYKFENLQMICTGGITLNCGKSENLFSKSSCFGEEKLNDPATTKLIQEFVEKNWSESGIPELIVVGSKDWQVFKIKDENSNSGKMIISSKGVYATVITKKPDNTYMKHCYYFGFDYVDGTYSSDLKIVSSGTSKTLDPACVQKLN